MSIAALANLGLLLVAAVMSSATGAPGGSSVRACANGADAAFMACARDQFGSYWIASGKCASAGDPAGQARCLQDARTSLKEARGECQSRRLARRDLCSAPGETLAASNRPVS